MLPSTFSEIRAQERATELREASRHAARAGSPAGRRGWPRRRRPRETIDGRIVLRLAGPADSPTLERLAALDDRVRPAGPLLLAEVNGEVHAALPLDGGAAMADPWRPTAGLVDLLSVRASQLVPNRDSGRRGRLVPIPTLAR